METDTLNKPTDDEVYFASQLQNHIPVHCWSVYVYTFPMDIHRKYGIRKGQLILLLWRQMFYESVNWESLHITPLSVKMSIFASSHFHKTLASITKVWAGLFLSHTFGECPLEMCTHKLTNSALGCGLGIGMQKLNNWFIGNRHTEQTNRLKWSIFCITAAKSHSSALLVSLSVYFSNGHSPKVWDKKSPAHTFVMEANV